MAGSTTRIVRKAAVGVVGGTVTAVGLALIPLPGPGTLITAGGLAILASEFETPRRALDAVNARVRRAMGRPSAVEDEPEPTKPGEPA